MTIKLTAILNMARGVDSIRKTLHHLSVQPARESLEVIVVTTAEKAPQIDPALLAAFPQSQVIQVPDGSSLAAGWGTAIRMAQAPYVVLCEDHSYPVPEWAAALIEATERKPDVIAPVMHNGNPQSLVSCANAQLCFVEWLAPEREGPISAGPGHNSCYRRDLLLAKYPALEQWLAAERLLHLDISAKGGVIWQDVRAATNHVNISKAVSFFGHSYHGGRVFGAWRARGWSRPRALLQAVAFPLVPLVRLRRLWTVLGSAQRRAAARFWPALPWTIAGLIFHAFGEAVGYTIGAGNAMRTYVTYEAHRIEHVHPREAALLLDPEWRPEVAVERPARCGMSG